MEVLVVSPANHVIIILRRRVPSRRPWCGNKIIIITTEYKRKSVGSNFELQFCLCSETRRSGGRGGYAGIPAVSVGGQHQRQGLHGAVVPGWRRNSFVQVRKEWHCIFTRRLHCNFWRRSISGLRSVGLDWEKGEKGC